MPHSRTKPRITRLTGRSGLRAQINANGSIRRIDCGDIVVNLFVGNELEGGPANLYLRRHAARRMQCTAAARAAQPDALCASSTRGNTLDRHRRLAGDLRYRVRLTLSHDGAGLVLARRRCENVGDAPQDVDLIYAQDLALAPYGAVRLNEYYVSQYVDHTPLEHAERGMRGRLAAEPGGGRAPSVVRDRIAAPRRAVRDRCAAGAWPGQPRGRDAGRRCAQRPAGAAPAARALDGRDPGRAVAAAAGRSAPRSASSAAVRPIIRRPRRRPISRCVDAGARAARSAAAAAGEPSVAGDGERPRAIAVQRRRRCCAALDLDDADAATRCSAPTRRHEERDERRRAAVLLPRRRPPRRAAREGAAVLRPHGHLLRTGRHADAGRDRADLDRLDGRRVPFDAHAGPRQHQPLAVDRAQLPRPVPLARPARVRRDRRRAGSCSTCRRRSRWRPMRAAGSTAMPAA